MHIAWMDLVNGIFEAGLSIFLARGVLMLRADKVVKGFWWPTVVWTTAWGVWNLVYYPHLGQWASFIGGVAIVLVNLTWLAHVAHYSKGDMTWHRVLRGGTDREDERRKFVSALYRRARINGAARAQRRQG